MKAACCFAKSRDARKTVEYEIFSRKGNWRVDASRDQWEAVSDRTQVCVNWESAGGHWQPPDDAC